MGRKQARMLSDSDEQVDEWGKRAEKVGALQGPSLGLKTFTLGKKFQRSKVRPN